MNELQYFDQLRDVMMRSGQLIMQYFRSDFEIFEKQGGSLVTTADLENEQFLKQELTKIVSHAGFLAEESGLSNKSSDYLWVIDPLDGTRNFVKGIPHFCIIVALTYQDEPIVATIYHPVTQEFYYAEKGKGLWYQGKRVQFIDQLRENKAAIAVCGDADWQQAKLKAKEENIQISRRYFGSAGIDAMYLVEGNIDFVVFRNIAWWDIAAGILLIREAGGLHWYYEKSQVKASYGTLKAGNQLFFNKNV